MLPQRPVKPMYNPSNTVRLSSDAMTAIKAIQKKIFDEHGFKATKLSIVEKAIISYGKTYMAESCAEIPEDGE